MSDERAREQLLNKVSALTLDQCSSVIDFVNQQRRLRADLVLAKHTYTDSQLISNILTGLPNAYRMFSKQYEWSRSTNPDSAPDLDFFIDRLLTEEQDVKRIAEERKRKEKEKKGESKSNNNNSSLKPKSTEVCTHCQKTGHGEITCWSAHPELEPGTIILEEGGGLGHRVGC